MKASTLKQLQDKKVAALDKLTSGAESFEDRLVQLDAVRALENVIRLQIRDDIDTFFSNERDTLHEMKFNIRQVDAEIQHVAAALFDQKHEYEGILRSAILKAATKMNVSYAEARRLLTI